MSEGMAFDPAAMMNASIDAEFDTKLIPIPNGEYPAQIGTGEKDVEITTGISKKNNKPWVQLVMMLDINDANLKQQLQRDQVRIRYSIMIDLDERGGIDTRPQRNIALGKLRAAVGQNAKGQWSFNMLRGQPLKVKVKQEKVEGYEDLLSQVVGVSSLNG